MRWVVSHQGLTDRRPITSRHNWAIRSILLPEYNTINWRGTTHFDSEDDYHTGCRSVSHCQQQSYLGLHSPRQSNSAHFWNDSWVQTFYSFFSSSFVACEQTLWRVVWGLSFCHLPLVSNIWEALPRSLFWAPVGSTWLANRQWPVIAYPQTLVHRWGLRTTRISVLFDRWT